MKQFAQDEGLEGGKFVRNLLLNIFDIWLEVTSSNISDNKGEDKTDFDCKVTESCILIWRAAVLVYWHLNDKVGKQIAMQLCVTSTENSHGLDDF